MSYSFGKSIVTDGLVFYVDAANDNSYPGTGTTWSDLVGENDGTLTNGPTFDSGNGGSIVFDGVDDYIEAGPIQPLQFTLSCWFKATGAPSNNDAAGGSLIASDPQLVGGLPFLFSHSYLDQTLSFYVETTVSPLRTASNSVVNNQIHLATATYNGTTGSIYINGQFANSKSFNSPTYNTSGNINLQIGRWGYSGYERFINGNIYNASIYNRALSSTEILQNYNALKNRFI